jgi:RimJ/RimL family protein N-acetyltransferase
METSGLARCQLQLRHAVSADIGLLYSIASQSPELWPRLCRRGLPNPQQFEQLAWSSVLVLSMVCHETTGAVVGLTSIYDPDHHNGTAQVEVVTPPLGADEEAAVTAAMVDHAFATWRFRKVYLENDGYRPPAIGQITRPCREEARLRDHVLHDGFLWDTVTTAVYRDHLPTST